MALFGKHKNVESGGITTFGVGDKVRVVQKIREGGKERSATFEGMIIGIKGRDSGTSFTVRRVGEAGVSIERIFPLNLPSIEKIEVVKHGTPGVRRAKLYYTRKKSAREVETIYTRAAKKGKIKDARKKRP